MTTQHDMDVVITKIEAAMMFMSCVSVKSSTDLCPKCTLEKALPLARAIRERMGALEADNVSLGNWVVDFCKNYPAFALSRKLDHEVALNVFGKEMADRMFPLPAPPTPSKTEATE